MRKVILYIAQSVDGYIADAKGQVAWLKGQVADLELPDTYTSFIQNVDTIIMGQKTYHQITTELAKDMWPYPEQQSYIVTHRPKAQTDKLLFTDKDPVSLVTELKKQPGKDIWICGGANLIAQLVEHDLIDVYQLTLIPTLLGQGIRLFSENRAPKELCLLRTVSQNRVVELTYERKKNVTTKDRS